MKRPAKDRQVKAAQENLDTAAPRSLKSAAYPLQLLGD